MANKKHGALVEADGLHEPKGAAAALAGTLMRATGSGTTEWTGEATLKIASATVMLSTVDQTPISTDVPLQVIFDSGVETDDVIVTAAGVITIKTKGTYLLEAVGRIGRTTGAGDAHILVRYTLNGSGAGFTVAETLADGSFSLPYKTTTVLELEVGDVLTGQVMTDSSGINNGGLLAFTPVVVGWSPIPSTSATLSRLVVG